MTFFEKNFSEKYSHILIFAVISLCVKYFCLFSVLEINAKIRNICEKNLSLVYANDTVLRGVCLTVYLAENQIFLNEAKWYETRI